MRELPAQLRLLLRLTIKMLYRQGMAIRETLAERDPSNTEWQRDLSISHNKVGEMLAAQGNATEALAAYRQGMAIRETLAERDPSNTEWQRDLSVSHDKVGEMLAAQGNATEALAAYRQGMAIRETLAERDPSNTEWQRDLIVSNVKMAELADEPVQRYRSALEIANELKQTNRLRPVDHWMILELERRLNDAAS